MSKRKEVETYILKYMNKIDKSGYNKKLYTDIFIKMSDKDFDRFMNMLKDTDTILPIFSPIWSGTDISVSNNIKVGKELGCPIFERVIQPSSTNPKMLFKTNIEYMVCPMPYRRVSQTLSKKINVPTDIRKRDSITEQVTGDSKASKVTLQESMIITSLGATKSLNELINFRGGDIEASSAIVNGIINHGTVTNDIINRVATSPGRTKALKSFIKAAHIDIES